jgi:hypothetical protein
MMISTCRAGRRGCEVPADLLFGERQVHRVQDFGHRSSLLPAPLNVLGISVMNVNFCKMTKTAHKPTTMIA